MTRAALSRLVLVVFAAGLAGCDNAGLSSPAAPSVVQQAPPPAPTSPPVSNGFQDVTLSGVVFEVTSTGRVPIEGADVYCEPCGRETHSWAFTDSNGVYHFNGVWIFGSLPTALWSGKDGYVDPAGLPNNTPPNPSGHGWREVRVTGNTRLDIELVRK